MSSNKRNHDGFKEESANSEAKKPGSKKFQNRRQEPRRPRNGDARKGSNGANSTSSLNDLSWYTHNARMADAASKVAFTNYPGRTVSLGAYTDLATGKSESLKRSLPGIITLNYVPSPGYAEDGTDPATIAGHRLYSAVREKFSGTLKADGPDMFMWIMACDSMLSYLAYLKRIYGTINLYRGENAYYPNGLLQAMGFTAQQVDALKADKMKFFGELSRLTSQVGMLTLPKRFDIFMRHYWLNERYYTDAPEISSQIYLFNPVGFYYFSDYSEQTGSSLKIKRLEPSTFTGNVVDELIAFGDALYDAFQKSESCWDIYGYFQKAFEGEAMISVGQTDYAYEAEIVYQPEVLLSIHNARACLGDVDWTSLDVSQDPNTNSILFKPTMAVNSVDYKLFGGVDPYLDIMVSSPNGAQVLLASRLHNAVGSKIAEDPNEVICSIIAGTEILVSIFMTQNSTSQPTVFTTGAIDQFFTVNLSNAQAAVSSLVYMMSDISTFDWHPLFWVSVVGTTEGIVFGTAPDIVSDIYNFTTMTTEQLETIHRVCVYSEFDVFKD